MTQTSEWAREDLAEGRYRENPELAIVRVAWLVEDVEELEAKVMYLQAQLRASGVEHG
jgi:hypothetical protein